MNYKEVVSLKKQVEICYSLVKSCQSVESATWTEETYNDKYWDSEQVVSKIKEELEAKKQNKSWI